MKNKKNPGRIYDIAGVGIGPFNLGLAALLHPIKKLKCIFFEQSPEFHWHPGMMIDGARLQVPYYADLVTMMDPVSPFTYPNFLHEQKDPFQFAIAEQYYPLRKEYDEYCRWVASKLDNLFFGMRCESVRYLRSKKIYVLTLCEIRSGSKFTYQARNLVIGVGTAPNVPECALPFLSDRVIHSGNYLYHKEKLISSGAVTIVGSGQSAAEIFNDLLQEPGRLDQLYWITRSERIFPMDLNPFALEMTSPDWIDFFYSLSPQVKLKLLSRQDALFKGINFRLLTEIHDRLGACRLEYPMKKIECLSGSELKDIRAGEGGRCELRFHHSLLEKEWTHYTNAVILATGYHYQFPAFLNLVKELGHFDHHGLFNVQRNYSVDKRSSLFVQNAEMHTHGFNAPDLGMGPYRNATIINTILGEAYYKLPKKIAYQTFGIPTDDMPIGTPPDSGLVA
jgi:lysine N6-hydroxylase